MVKHAIVLASREWCEAASSGRIKVYDFVKPRKHRIHALVPSSVCVVLTKAEPGKPPAMYGEFTVKEVKEVDAEEYSRLARQGLIYNPQRLEPGEKRWIILFDEFRKYHREVLKRELTDVKTAPNKKPVSKWTIIGLTYITDNVLGEIRRRAGGYVTIRTPQLLPSLDERLRGFESRIKGLEEKVDSISELLGISKISFPISHVCAEFMLMNIGRDLGFRVYTSDPSKECGGKRLGDLINMSREYLSGKVGHEILEPLSRVDVIWYKESFGFYAFEVVIGGSMHEALLRLSRISELNPKLFIVSGENMRREYEEGIRNPAFTSIRRKCKFISLGELVRMYILTSLWRRSIENLQLPYISR